MNWSEVDSGGWAACYVDLMIIMDEWMKRSMHLWSVNNQIKYSICPFWGWSWRSPSLCRKTIQEITSLSECLLQAPLGVKTGALRLSRDESSYRKELWGTLSIAVLCLRVSVGVFMLNTLHHRKQNKQAQKNSSNFGFWMNKFNTFTNKMGVNSSFDGSWVVRFWKVN